MKMFLVFFFLTSNLCIFLCDKGQRIIGGELAHATQYPFVVSFNKTTKTGRYFCAGTILNQRWILTAGQCVTEATSFSLLIGTLELSPPLPGLNGHEYAAEEYVLHPEFDPLTLENDLGLIKLRMNLTYNEPATLATFEVEENVADLRVVGWGQTSDDAGLSNYLRWVEVASISNQQCRITFGNQITDNMICAVGSYNEGACHGDTGGPLVYPAEDGSFLVSGIASFVSANGCESTDPSGYTRIFPYLEWIQSVISV